MIRNGGSLYTSRPLTPIEHTKQKAGGVSFGMSEAGYDVRIKQRVTLSPESRFALASTVEHFTMPPDLVGVVHDKSSWARRGLSVFNTVIEPGWRGFLTLELVYHGSETLTIEAGSGIAQVIFHELAEPRQYTGRYQDQADNPVEAIVIE